jgi:RecG-like helicase
MAGAQVRARITRGFLACWLMMAAACHTAHRGRLLVEHERLDGALALDIDLSARPRGEAGRRKLSGYARRDLDLARQPCDSIRLAMFTVSPTGRG